MLVFLNNASAYQSCLCSVRRQECPCPFYLLAYKKSAVQWLTLQWAVYKNELPAMCKAKPGIRPCTRARAHESNCRFATAHRFEPLIITKKKPWHLQNVTSNLGSSFKWYSCKNKRVAIFTNDSLTTVFQILVQKQLISPDQVVCKLLRQTLGSNECCVLETFVPDTCTKVDESWSTNNSLDHHPEIF